MKVGTRVFRMCCVLGLMLATVASGRGQESPSVDRCIEILSTKARLSPARIVEFTEVRSFPFRSKTVEIKGVARIAQDLGSSIEYPSKDSAIIIDQEGTLLRRFKDDGAFRQRAVEQAGEQGAELMVAALRFDEERIRSLFDVSVEGDTEAWTLVLQPKGELSEKVERIAIATRDEAVQSVTVALNGDRKFHLQIEKETGLDGFSAEERARYFR